MNQKKKKNRRQKRRYRKYLKFIEENQAKYDLHYAIYGQVYIVATWWTLKNTFSWAFGFIKKPGFSFENPENVEVTLKKNRKHG